MTAAEFSALAEVDDAVIDRLQTYLELLSKWQRRINLVGTSTLDDPWRRHFLDSAQLCRHIEPDDRPLYDIGSGAGFPGLVLAVMGIPGVGLVESDQRKAAFLREVIRATDANAEVIVARVEELAPERAGIITARACAPLEKLLRLTTNLWTPETIGLLHKGRNVDAELTLAHKSWNIRVEKLPSLSDPEGVILRISERENRRET